MGGEGGTVEELVMGPPCTSPPPCSQWLAPLLLHPSPQSWYPKPSRPWPGRWQKGSKRRSQGRHLQANPPHTLPQMATILTPSLATEEGVLVHWTYLLVVRTPLLLGKGGVGFNFYCPLLTFGVCCRCCTRRLKS